MQHAHAAGADAVGHEHRGRFAQPARRANATGRFGVRFGRERHHEHA